MALSNFFSQVQEYLSLDIQALSKLEELEGGGSLCIRKYKEIVVKVPYPEEANEFEEGYKKAYEKGFITDLEIKGCEVFVPFVEGSLSKDFNKLPDLWNQMELSNLYLADWKWENLLLCKEKLVVIDWGYWTEDKELALLYYSQFLKKE